MTAYRPGGGSCSRLLIIALSLLTFAAAAASATAALSVMPSSGPSHPDDVPGAFGSDVQDLPFAEATKYGSSRMDLQSSAGSRQTPPLSNSGAPAQLPDCSTIDRLRRLKPVEPLPELVLVSTADGQVTAVDGSGRVVWRTDTGRPLLQASLKKISRDDGRGGSATYIPSLDGSLYKFDGKQIEVVATADSVMYSSVKTDPWVLTGGRETKTLGIDPRTGQIRYVCTMNGGCTTFTRNEGDKNGPHKETPGPAEGDGAEADKAKNTGDKDETTSRAVLVIRRHTQTVRAIEPRSGREEWFYSVGVNELQFVEDEQTGCSQRPTPSHRRSQVAFGDDETVDGSHYETDLRVVVNKGVVSGTDHSGQSVNWSLELGSPIVGAWHLSADGILEEVDLFEPTHLVGMDPQGSQPIFYVGVFQQHLYLQQNPRIVRNNRMLANYWFNQQRGFGSIAGENRAMIEYSPTAKGLGSEDHTIGPQVLTMAFDEDNQGNDQQTALVPLSPREILEHVDSDNCFYFMQDDVEVDHTLPSVLPTMVEEPAEAHIEGAHRTQRTTEDNEWPDESVEDAPIIYVVNSLGNYWREIAIISIICSVAVNILLTRILPRLGWRSPEEPPALMAPHSAVQTVLSGSGESVREVTPTTTAGSSTKTVTPSDRDLQPTVASTALSRSESAESSSVVNAANFVSRYVTDFVPVRCLGKGGFGIVFESRNKIDDCSYAVKRIRLPARQGAREKVLREVKALAKLDHQHIVRYYNSWLETPPAGWQQDMDAVWRTTLPVSTTNALSTGVDGTPAETGTTTANESSEPADSVGHCQQDAGDAKDIRKLVDGFNPFRPFDAILDSWQSSEPDQRPDKDVTQEDNSGGSGSWASDLVDQVVVASDSDDDVDAENEHQDDGDNLSASSGIDGLNRQENEDSIVFASDDRSSLSRFGALVTRRRKSDNVPLCDENALRVWGDEEVLKENDSKDINKNDKNNKITARKRPNSLPPLAGGMADAATENPRQTVYLYIQIELCKKESLKDWLAEKKTLDERGHDKVLEIFYQISLAVEYVHESGLIHRDLKPSNIFFATAGDVVKVGDFGLVTGTEGMVGITSIPAGTPGAHGDVSTRGEDASDVQSVRFDRQLTDKVGTQLYMSHEQVAGSKYNQKVDIFALGLILFELLWSLPTQMERVRTLSAVKQLRFPKGFKREFQDEYQLVRSMLAADPSLRPTAQEVLRHSLFNEIRQNSAKRLRHRTNSSRNSHSSHEGASSVR